LARRTAKDEKHPAKEKMTMATKNNVISRSHFARQKELECQLSFLPHLQNAVDWRWALGAYFAHSFFFCGWALGTGLMMIL